MKKKRIDRSHLPDVMKDDQDLLDIPRYLDRSKWTKKDWEENTEHWKRIQEVERAKALAKQQAKEAEMAKWHAERVANDKAKTARNERRAARQARKAAKQENANKVLTALEAGHNTMKKIREFLGFDSNRPVHQGLRILIKTDRVEKIPNKRRYRVIFGGQQEMILVTDKGTRVIVEEATPTVKKRGRSHLPPEMARTRSRLPKSKRRA